MGHLTDRRKNSLHLLNISEMPTIRSQHPPFKDYFGSEGGHSPETEILLNDSGFIIVLEEVPFLHLNN